MIFVEVLQATTIPACFEKFLKSRFIVVGKCAITLYMSCLKRKEMLNFSWICKTSFNKRLVL